MKIRKGFVSNSSSSSFILSKDDITKNKNINIEGEVRYFRFFANKEKLIKVINDHFLNNGELWLKFSGMEKFHNFLLRNVCKSVKSFIAFTPSLGFPSASAILYIKSKVTSFGVIFSPFFENYIKFILIINFSINIQIFPKHFKSFNNKTLCFNSIIF